jgi:hypothetical protein
MATTATSNRQLVLANAVGEFDGGDLCSYEYMNYLLVVQDFVRIHLRSILGAG